MYKMNFISISLSIVIIFHQNSLIRGSIDRPTRREIETNKTIFMYVCIEKGTCKEYAQQNALKHVECHFLCDMSWKWAQSRVDSDPLFTLPPVQEATYESEPSSGHNSNTRHINHGLYHFGNTDEGQVWSQKPSMNKKYVGREHSNRHNDGVLKSSDQVMVEKLKRKHKKATDSNHKKSPVKENKKVIHNSLVSAVAIDSSPTDSDSSSASPSTQSSAPSEESETEDSKTEETKPETRSSGAEASIESSESSILNPDAEETSTSSDASE